MSRDRGAVLINALVIVLAISAVAATLLTRSESARIRISDSQNAHQLALYLDSAEALVPGLLQEVTDGSAVHLEQAWASDALVFPIERGSVAVKIVDLQSRLNVNWLMRDDPFVQDLFATLFTELDLPQSLLREITEFVAPNGPLTVNDYLSRRPSILPRGGPLLSLDDLREVVGMTPALFARLDPYVAALPNSSRLNLNTASKPLRAAALRPLPPKVQTEFLNRDTPILALSDLRRRVMEVLETEDIDDLPVSLLTVSSNRFQVELRAELDGMVQRRKLLFQILPATERPIRRGLRWAVYD
mgnify:CR=1 FL=1